MAEILVQEVLLTGLEETTQAAAAGGDYFVNDGKTVLHVINGSAGDITVTVDSPKECNQGFTHDAAVVVTAGEERFIGPFDRKRFNDANGRVQVTYSGVTSLTVAALRSDDGV